MARKQQTNPEDGSVIEKPRNKPRSNRDPKGDKKFTSKGQSTYPRLKTKQSAAEVRLDGRRSDFDRNKLGSGGNQFTRPGSQSGRK